MSVQKQENPATHEPIAISGSNNDEDHYLTEARRLLKIYPLIDGHNDFPYIIRGWCGNRIKAPDLPIHQLPIGQTDIARLRKGHMGAQFWSAFVPCPVKTDDFSTSSLLPSLLQTLQQIDLIHCLIARHPQHFALAKRADDILPIFRSGRIASLIGVEGLHQIANSASVLRMYHRLGVRYVTLCHDSNTKWADAAASSTQPHGGLSDDGKRLIKEMNRIGMIIDLSHTSHATQRDALSISKAPVIFSHSSCHALTPQPRNVPDDTLHLLKQNNGLLMICFLPNLVHPILPPHSPSNTTTTSPSHPSINSIASHIIHAGTLIGYAHVGIGSDFDGMLSGPQGLDDVSMYPSLIAELLRRGLGEREVQMVCGENLVRVLRDVEGWAREVGERAVGRGMDGEGGKEGEEGQIMWDEGEIGEVWSPEQREMVRKMGVEREGRRDG